MFTSERCYTAILLIALCLRLIHLGGPSLWYDECLTARLTWLVSPSQILQGTALDVHPPLYYLLVAGWRRFAGSSEAALRFPSVMFGMVALIIWKRIGEELQLPSGVTLLALALMAISPSLIFYSQETRMYSLLIFTVSLATLGVLQQSSPLLFLGGTLAMYTQNMAWCYLLALGILAVIWGWPIYDLASTCALIGLAYFPWAYRLFVQVQELSQGYWIPPLSLGGIAYSIYPLTWFFAIPSWAAVHGATIALSLATIALWKAIPRFRQLYPLLIMWLGPIVATAIISWLWQPMFFYRPLMAVVPPMLFLIAYAFLQMNQRNAILLALLAVPLLGFTLYRQISDERGLRQSERDNAMILAENWQDGDCIFHMNVGSMVTMEYYLPDKPQFIWAGPAALFNGALSVQTQETLLLDRREFEDLPGTCQRVWLNWWSNPLTGVEEDAEARRLIAWYHGQKFHTFVSNDMVEATLWILFPKKDLDHALETSSVQRGMLCEKIPYKN